MPALIIVADDNSTIRELLAEVLEGEGYRVLPACDGAEALALIERERPDLLLTDNMMPHLSGRGLIAQLRARPIPALPVILMSAAPLGTIAPPTRCLAKPFGLDQLLALVASLLSRTACPA